MAIANARSVAAQAGGVTGSVTETVPDIIQQTASPMTRIILYGRAARIAYAIPLPTLIRVGNQQAVRDRIIYADDRAATIDVDGHPIRTLQLAIEFILASPATAPLPLPANPALGIAVSGGRPELQIPIQGK